MKKFALLFLVLVFFSSFVFSYRLPSPPPDSQGIPPGLYGLDYEGVDAGKFIVDEQDDVFILTLKQGNEVTATSEVIQAINMGKEVVLVLEKGSKLFNKDGLNLGVGLGIQVIMKGERVSETEVIQSEINSRGKHISIENLTIKGFALISSFGGNGANGSWSGPMNEGDCGECGNTPLYRKCSIDNDSQQRYAKPGENAGEIFVNFLEVYGDVTFLSKGGKGGNGANGRNEKGSLSSQKPIRGGNGAKGGNAGKIEVQELIAENGVITFNSSGGEGGKGGNGGNNTGFGGAHDGGDGGKGGIAAEIIISSSNNQGAKILSFSSSGKAGLGGAGGTTGWFGCAGLHGRIGENGFAEKIHFKNLSGFAPLYAEGKDFLLKSYLSEQINFFPGTNYTTTQVISIYGCNFGGQGFSLNEDNLEQISMTSEGGYLFVWNPLSFSDKVFLNIHNLSILKNIFCNLNPRHLMRIPFNGRIKENQMGGRSGGSQTPGEELFGAVKNIKIKNSLGETEFSDASERPFANGVFSTVIEASLYSNTLYKVEFDVCSEANVCDSFVFNFFTWKRLW